MKHLLVLIGLSLAAAEQDCDRFLAELGQKRAAVRTLQAHFTQTSTTPDETRVSHGAVRYAKPGKILFKYREPEVAYLMDGLKLYKYDAELRQLEIFNIENEPETQALFLGLDDDTQRLKEAFDLELFEPGDLECGTQGVVLRPKARKSEGGYFERVRLFLREQDYLPCRILIVNDADSQVEMALSDYKINGEADSAAVKIAVPEGTKVFEEDEYIETVGPAGKSVPPGDTAREAAHPPQAATVSDSNP
jgi:outer membrane lipoprotein-sorting protein